MAGNDGFRRRAADGRLGVVRVYGDGKPGSAADAVPVLTLIVMFEYVPLPPSSACR